MPQLTDYSGSTLRQLKFLVVVLIVSNLVLGFFGVHLLRDVDRKYSALIEQAVPSLNELQTLTALSMEAMRNTNPTLFVAPAQGRAEMVTRARAALDRDRDMRKHALQREWLSVKGDDRPNLEESGQAFSRTAAQVVNLIESGDATGAARLREQSLRPVFDRYIADTTKTTDILEAESLRSNDRLTTQTGSMSHMLIGLAGWPVMFIVLFFLIALIFVLTVLLKVLILRRAEI